MNRNYSAFDAQSDLAQTQVAKNVTITGGFLGSLGASIGGNATCGGGAASVFINTTIAGHNNGCTAT